MRKLIGSQITEPPSTQFIRHLLHRFHSPAGQGQRQRRRRPSRIINWSRQLKRTARSLSFNKYGSGHIPGEKNVQVPKGHMAVSVGAEDDDCRRIVVPVLYCNHPLFAELLKEAEEKYGFDHPGGIRIPCQMSEFENVTAQIAAGRSFGDIARKKDSTRKAISLRWSKFQIVKSESYILQQKSEVKGPNDFSSE